MREYNGHRSWNAWNVSLWINNDEFIYSRAVELVRQFGIYRAATRLMGELPARTPDGAKYTHMALRLAIEEIE